MLPVYNQKIYFFRRVSFEQGQALQLVDKVELHDKIQKKIPQIGFESDGRMGRGFGRQATCKHSKLL